MLTLLLALQLTFAAGTADDAALWTQYSTLQMVGDGWKLTLQAGDAIVEGDEAAMIRGFWPKLYPALNCTEIREQADYALRAGHRYYPFMVYLATGIDSWAVKVGPHGAIEFDGQTTPKAQAVWAALGKELARRCWQEPYD